MPARLTVTLFGATMFLAAALLFLIQPAAAKLLLPQLGGSAVVWTTCMVFFQAVLLLGYLYAHLTSRHLSPRAGVAVHAAVLVAALLFLPPPLASFPTADPPAHPFLWVISRLASSTGLTVFVLATTGPLLQRWSMSAPGPTGRDPYRFYAASNAGSLLALFGYPLAVEPLLSLPAQGRLWRAGYALFTLGAAGCALLSLRRPPQERRPCPAGIRSGALPIAVQLRWVFLAFAAVSLMLGTTEHLCTDIAPFPLLWALPLGIYLLTFILCFSRPRLLPPALVSRHLPAIAVPGALLSVVSAPVALTVPVGLLLLFWGAQLCHGRLAQERPAGEQLTGFCLLVALGGVLGGLLHAVLAPALFPDLFEYPIAILLVCLVRPRASPEPGPAPARLIWARSGWPLLLYLPPLALGCFPRTAFLLDVLPPAVPLVPLAWVTLLLARRRQPLFVGALAVFLIVGSVVKRSAGSLLHLERSFYGIHSVAQDRARGLNLLVHGGTVHGMQRLEPGRRPEPLAYYHRAGPLGQLFAAYPAGFARVAAVGLGAGSLAAYGRAGQQMTFYELDPGVIRTARQSRLFSYLPSSAAAIRVVQGDGRVGLARTSDGSHDLIVLDAFSSDAVPVHLLTREAIALYLRKLAPGGVLAAHVSNRNFFLEPVLAATAAELGLAFRAARQETDAAQQNAGHLPSRWVALARAERSLAPLAGQPSWRSMPVASNRQTAPWTDDHANLLGALNWWGEAR